MEQLAYAFDPGTPFRMDDVDPDERGGFDKKTGKELTAANLERLRDLQERLWADGGHALLIVLQAMDAGGKDGTIKHVMGGFNPQGVRVTSFKAPSSVERAHDFLWRVHAAAPGRGQIGIFNRSHYEEVLVVRARQLKPDSVWRRYYDHINAFERLLADEGVTIVKLFLRISPEEQAERFLDRQQRRDKQWKFNPEDLDNRRLWPAYMTAFEEALTRCNTEWAPWHVIPANRKWFRNLAVSQLLVDTMERMQLSYPDPVPSISSYSIPEVPPR
jgi:PPK2 family polyphosphate:nucleotide phosphotransferase